MTEKKKEETIQELQNVIEEPLFKKWFKEIFHYETLEPEDLLILPYPQNSGILEQYKRWRWKQQREQYTVKSLNHQLFFYCDYVKNHPDRGSDFWLHNHYRNSYRDYHIEATKCWKCKKTLPFYAFWFKGIYYTGYHPTGYYYQKRRDPKSMTPKLLCADCFNKYLTKARQDKLKLSRVGLGVGCFTCGNFIKIIDYLEDEFVVEKHLDRYYFHPFFDLEGKDQLFQCLECKKKKWKVTPEGSVYSCFDGEELLFPFCNYPDDYEEERPPLEVID